MRRHSPSPSFASRVPIPTFFRHWSRQQGGFSKGNLHYYQIPPGPVLETWATTWKIHLTEKLSCSAIFHKSQSGIALFSEQPLPKRPPLPPCMFVNPAKSRPELGPLRTGTSGIPRLAHHGPIFFLRPPACTLLHSPPNVKPHQLLLGLRTNISQGRDINGGDCKVA